jgi:site-specific DNA-methyltransferase (adenine-specific)
VKPTIDLENAKVFFGSCLDVLPTLADNSVDAIVTDPPYELGFMGKSWDNSGIAYNVDVWKECLRVLKPGGHILAFGGSRTWHRLAVAIEDSGFEMRDSIAWLYGSGFPKSHNISKAIDKLHGAEREVIGRNPNSRENATKDNTLYESGTVGKTDFITEANTDDAKKWDGWGTALKPAHEPIVVARKPLIGTVAENVLKHGVGGINIDATRIGTGEGVVTFDRTARTTEGNTYDLGTVTGMRESGQGRWPANIILDETTAELLDEQSGISKSKPEKIGAKGGSGFGFFDNEKTAATLGRWPADNGGGASRFFYVAKASKRDRNEGLENIEGKEISAKGNGLARTCNTCGASTLDGCACPDRTFSNPVRQNFHPTVKPTALMQYLIRLVTPDNGVVLDPFAGSGSTGKAAILEGKRFIGIELTAEYLPIIEGRLKHAYLTLDDKEDDLFE